MKFITPVAKRFVSSKLLQNPDVQSFSAKCMSTTYFQGQSPEPKIREYFYFMDHQGMLFLDDSLMKNFTSCFKDKQFLRFFISRISHNNVGRYKEFPYVSLCGKERNYLRCDDVPIVFTKSQQTLLGMWPRSYCQRKLLGQNNSLKKLFSHTNQQIHSIQLTMLDENSQSPLISYGHCDRLLTVDFEPEKICMLPSTGRVYHPAKNKICGLGLVSDKLSVLWSEERRFVFENGEEQPPTHFIWKKSKVELTNELVPELKSLKLDRR